MSDQRTYHSPLRERQAQATREQILEALIETVSETGAQDLNIRELATRAGVSERTVYRHFADRRALLDGLVEHLEERAGWTGTGSLDTPADLRAAIEKDYRSFDRLERETRALVLMNLDPARTATQTREHIDEIRDLVSKWFPELPDNDVSGVGAVFSLLASSRTWLRMLDGHGLKADQSAKYVGWVLDLLVRELESGAPIPDPLFLCPEKNA